MMKTIAPLVAATMAVLSAGAAEKKLFAHYMGCWPATFGPIVHQHRNEAKILAAQADRWSVVGGEFVNWPLVPQGFETNLAATCELEIRRAMRAGFDGFAVDAWSGGDGAKRCFEELIAAAERMKAPFEVTVCMDPSCHMADKTRSMYDKYLETIRFAFRHKDSPNFAHWDGKPMILGYYSRGIIGWPFKWPSVRNEDDVFRRDAQAIAEAYAKLRKEFDFPIFIHGDIAGMVNFSRPNDLGAKLGDWAARVYDACGAFTGTEHGNNWAHDPRLAAAVRAGGSIWSQPLVYQYQNKFGGLISGAGFDVLRRCWEDARKNGSDFMQFVTWNDYGEETNIAPGYGSNYSVARLNRFFADWWRAGRPPKVTEDEIHVSFKRFVGEGRIFPFYGHFERSPQVIEVVTLLTKPATVELRGYGTWKAPAGYSYRQFPEKEGAVEVDVRRGKGNAARSVRHLLAPERISSVRWRQDETMYAFGTNYDSEWEKDFPGIRPFYYSENGDADGDGLPNWFEMVYFGRMPFHDTATAADPAADPDGDGLTNLQEYRGRTDPRFKDEPYRAGDRWCASNDLCASVCTFNPQKDFRRNDVWYLLQRPKDGEWEKVPCNEWSPIHHSYPTRAGGVIRLEKSGRIVLGANAGEELAVGWRAPVGGVFDINGRKRTLRKGEFVRLREKADLENLVITLEGK